jgi:hypothetical protein
VTLDLDGSVYYTPEAGFHGVDQFTYRATDGPHLSNIATITITVNAPGAGTPTGTVTFVDTTTATTLCTGTLNGSAQATCAGCCRVRCLLCCCCFCGRFLLQTTRFVLVLDAESLT